MKKIVGAMVVGRGEGDRWLKPCLEQFRIFDGAIIVQNNVDAKTKKVIKESGFQTYEDNREWGKLQPKIKEELAQRLGAFGPDWVLSLDADEFIEMRLTRQTLEELASKKYDIAYYFWCIELWDRADQYREDFTFDDVRFWKYLPNLLSFRHTPVHCGMAPEWNYRWGTHSGYFFKHYGLLRSKDRLRKVERYKKYDNKGIYLPKEWYESLKAKNPPLKPFLEEDIVKILPETIFRKKIQVMPSLSQENKKYWKFINPHGVLITFDQEGHYRQRINDPKWKFLGVEDAALAHREEVNIVNDDPAVEAPELKPMSNLENLECVNCGFIAKTPRGLKIHTSHAHAVSGK